MEGKKPSASKQSTKKPEDIAQDHLEQELHALFIESLLKIISTEILKDQEANLTMVLRKAYPWKTQRALASKVTRMYSGQGVTLAEAVHLADSWGININSVVSYTLALRRDRRTERKLPIQ